MAMFSPIGGSPRANRTLSLMGGAALALLFATPAHAQSWIGSKSSDWFDKDNWDNGQVPIATDDVILDKLVLAERCAGVVRVPWTEPFGPSADPAG